MMSGILMGALVAAQRAISPVGKASRNAHHDYRYASGDDMIAEARGALNGAGLAVYATKWERTEHPYQYEDQDGKMRDDVEYRLFVSFRLAHESGESEDFAPFSVPILPERGRPIDKAEAGARTYALSYFLRDLLLIPRTAAAASNTETDPDARDDRGHVPPKKAGAPKPKAPESAPKHEPKVRTGDDVVRRFDRMCGDFPHAVGRIRALLAEYGAPEEIPTAVPTVAVLSAYSALGRLARELLEEGPPKDATDATEPATSSEPEAEAAPTARLAEDDEPRPNSPEDLGVNRTPVPMPGPKKVEAIGGLAAKVRDTRSRCDHLAGKIGGDAPARLLEEFERIGKVVHEPETFGTIDQARALQQLGVLQSKLLDEQKLKTATAMPAAT